MKKLFYFLLICFLSISEINAQTNPTSQSIPYTQNFSTLTGSTPAYPAGWQGWTVSGSLSTSFSTSAPNADQAITVVTNTSTSSHVGDFIGKMGVMSTGAAIKAICLSLNTTLLSNVQVVYDAQTQRTENSRLNQLGLQYRIGTSGVFTNIVGSGYLNQLSPTNTAGTGAVATSTKTVVLPAACDNQSVVQIRWVIRDSSGSGTRPGFSIDNINVTGTAVIAPSVSASPSSFSGFTYIEGFGPSTSQNFNVSGSNLTVDLIVNAPSNYQIDTNSSGLYYNSISFVPTSGTVATRTIYARLISGLTAASSPYNQTLTVSSTGATTQNVSVNGTVTNACTAPVSQPTALVFGTITPTSIAVSFTATSANSYLVIQSTSSTLSGVPVNGSTYVLGATVFGGTVVHNSTTTSFTSSGLSFLTHYYYFLFAYNNLLCGGGPTYNTAMPLSRDTTTLPGPCIADGFNAGITPPSGWSFNTINGTYSSAGNFGLASPSLQLDNTGDQVTTSIIASPDIASSLSFWMKGQGTMTGSSLLVEGFVGGSWITIHNITGISTSAITRTYNSSTTPALPYGVTQVRITYTKGSGNLALDDISIFCTTPIPCIEPTAQPTSVSFSSVTHNSMTIDWIGGSGDGSLVVVRQTSPVSATPFDGVTYNPSAVFGVSGSGRTTALNQYVVYVGTGNSVNITGLIPSNTYQVAVFEYNFVSSYCYLDALTATASQTTLPPPIVVTPTSFPTLSYIIGAGPSSDQLINTSATGLSPASGSVDISLSSSNFEISLTSGSGYTSSLSLAYTSGTLSSTPIYLRLKSGLNIGVYTTNISATNNIDTTIIIGNGLVNQAPCSNLFISEYIEGSVGNEKYLEIYNASDFAINLSNYKLLVYGNGSINPTTADSTLSGTLNPHTTKVYKNAGAVLYTGAATNSNATFFNGNDAVALFDKIQNTNIDIVGKIGEDPGSAWTASGGRTTIDKTLIRKFSVTKGININPSVGFASFITEWDTLSVNDISNLGIYRNICCVPVTNSFSQVICPGDLLVFNGETLTVSGIYRDTLVNHLGCDSFLILNLTINAPGVGGCPVPPANDNMCTPMVVTPSIAITTPYSASGFANLNTHTDTIIRNNGSSSFQIGESIGSCGGSGTNNKTMWYKFTMPHCATPQVLISTDDRSTTNFNTRVSVYRRLAPYACTSPFVEISCNDDGILPSNTGATTNSTITLTPNSSSPGVNEYVPGEEVYIQTSGVGAASGNYGLIIDVEPYIPLATSVTGSSATLDWSVAMTSSGWGGISGTYVQWRPVGAGPTVAGTSRYVAGPGTTHTISGLMPGVAYEYWASYVCGNGGRWWSKKGTFTTLTTCSGTAPSISGVAPGTSCSSAVVSYTASDPAYTSYRIISKRVSTGSIGISGLLTPAPGVRTHLFPSVLPGATYQFWIVGFCGTARVDSSAITSYVVCTSLRQSEPNATEPTDIEKDVVYVMPNGDIVYGLPLNMMDIPFDINNPNEQVIELQTIDANEYFGRNTVSEAVIAKVGEMSIYPNPATTEATLSYTLSKASSNMTIQVLDAQGKVMVNETISNPDISGTYSINLNNYSAGIYFVKLQAGDYTDIKKLVVDRR